MPGRLRRNGRMVYAARHVQHGDTPTDERASYEHASKKSHIFFNTLLAVYMPYHVKLNGQTPSDLKREKIVV